MTARNPGGSLGKLLFVVNPVAARCPRHIESLLRRRFPAAEVRRTAGPGDASVLAREALSEPAPPETIVACGGDGTLREVASAVGGHVPMGFVPLGTVNLLARELGIPLAVDGALDVLNSGSPVAVYGGRCFVDEDPEGRLFLIAVSAGPDADAVHRVRRLGKGVLGRYVYPVCFLARLLRPVRPEIRFRTELGAQGQCGELLALRLPHYGGDYRISKSLSPFTPGLEVVTADPGRRSTLRLFWSVFRSRPGPVRGVTRLTARSIVVDLPMGGRYQMDGDPFFARGLRLAEDPNPIHLVAPRVAAPLVCRGIIDSSGG